MAAGDGWSQEVWDDIVQRLSAGETLSSICRTEGYPCRETVHSRKHEVEEFGGQFARAKDLGYESIAEDTLEIADDARNDWMERQSEDNPGWLANGEHIQRSKLRIETRLKLLAKWDPKRYGDRVAHELTGPNGGPLQTVTREMTAEEAARVYREQMG